MIRMKVRKCFCLFEGIALVLQKEREKLFWVFRGISLCLFVYPSALSLLLDEICEFMSFIDVCNGIDRLIDHINLRSFWIIFEDKKSRVLISPVAGLVFASVHLTITVKIVGKVCMNYGLFCLSCVLVWVIVVAVSFSPALMFTPARFYFSLELLSIVLHFFFCFSSFLSLILLVDCRLFLKDLFRAT